MIRLPFSAHHKPRAPQEIRFMAAMGFLFCTGLVLAQALNSARDRRQAESRPSEDAMQRNANSFDSLKTQLRATDEEWKVIGPQVRKVMSARRAVQSGLNVGEGFDRGFFRGGPRGFGPPGRGPFERDSFSGPAAPGEFGASSDRSREGMDRRAPTTRPQFDDRRRESFDRDPTVESRPNFDRFGDGNRPGPGPGFPFGGGEITRAMSELQKVAAQSEVSPELLKSHIETVRAARQKAKNELAAAEKDLLALLTPDQEAMLIALGYLE